MQTETSITVRTADLLTATRAAEFLNISRMTLWRWVRVGKIRPIEVDNQRFFHINELQTLKETRRPIYIKHTRPGLQKHNVITDKELDKM